MGRRDTLYLHRMGLFELIALDVGKRWGAAVSKGLSRSQADKGGWKSDSAATWHLP